jgi:hypothetical protein
MATAEEELLLRVRAAGARAAERQMRTLGRTTGGVGSAISKSGRMSKMAGAQFTRFTGTIKKMGMWAKRSIFGLAALAGVMAFEGVKSAQKYTQVQNQTRAVIKSMGADSWTSQKKVAKLSEKIGDVAAMDPTSIQKAANMLLTFGKVTNRAGKGNDIYSRALKGTIGMQAAFNKAGKGNVSASVQLGKALNDPIKGITALRRVGVMFSSKQQKVITDLVKSGHLLQAQKLIMKEVAKEFPIPKPTPWQQLTHTIDELQKKFGLFLLPYLNKGARWLNKFVKGAEKGTGAGGKFVDVVKDIGGKINQYLIQPIRNAVKWMMKSHDRMTALAIGLAIVAGGVTALGIALWILSLNPITLTVAAVAVLAAGMYYLYQRSATFRTILKDVWAVMKHVPIIEVARLIISHFDQIVGFVKKLPGRIAGAASGMWNGLKSGLVAALNWIIGALNKIHFKIPSWVPGVGGNNFGFNIAPIGGEAKRPAQTNLAGTGHLAEGGLVRKAGVFEVGERGRERVALPAGAAVTPLPAGPMVIEFHHTSVLDGRTVTKSVSRHVAKAKSTR